MNRNALLGRRALLVVLAATMAGCASPGVMTASRSQEIPAGAPDKAQVVFMRTSMVAGAIGADLFEVVDGQLRFIGALGVGDKIVYETTPGEKVFMAYGMASDFMLGNLAAGRTYYSIVRPNWGSGGMIPTPIRSDRGGEFHMHMPEFRKWVADTRRVEPDRAQMQDWFNKGRETFESSYKRYWAQFQTKTPEQKAERTLRPRDGLPLNRAAP
jgi:hypothetical protein